jgi:hypothetical protein
MTYLGGEEENEEDIMSTSKIRKIITGAATLTLVAGLTATTAGAASASTQWHPTAPPREAVGSVELGNPLQYEQFLALQGFGRFHGDVDYTNWTYADPGSGVWAPAAGQHGLVFTYQGSQYAHTLNGGLKLVARSPEQLAFRGSGEYNGQAGATWAISGQVVKGTVRATITYNGTVNPGYSVTLVGTVASDGSVSGTAKDSLGEALTFTMPTGSFVSVLHYIAPIQAAQVLRHDATFRFTIPASVPGLAGTSVTVKVHDGGWGRWCDTYAHGVTGTPLSPYPIIGGPGITVW